MRKQSLVCWGLVSCALLVGAGCKKDATTQTAADVEPVNPVVVLDAGQEPKLLLRYRIPEGTTTASTATFQVSTLATSKDAELLTVLPGLRLDIVSGPAAVTENGFRFQVDVVKSEAVIPKGFDEELAADLRAGASLLDELGGWFEMDGRGIVLASEFNQSTKRADIPTRLLRMIVNTRTTVTRVLLPAEPVGVGARWETKREMEVFGFKVTQIDTYQLVDKAGDELMLNLTAQQMAAPQTVSFPEDGIEITIESMSSKAKGQIILNLDALESDASANGTSRDDIAVKTADGVEDIEVDEVFDVQIANTTDLMPDQPINRR